MIFRSDRKKRGKRSCLTATETNNDIQTHAPLSTFEFARYASLCSTWKFWTSRYLLLQTEKYTTHSERILGKLTQGNHSDATRTKIIQTETKKLSERRRCSSESQLHSKSLAYCLHNQDIS